MAAVVSAAVRRMTLTRGLSRYDFDAIDDGMQIPQSEQQIQHGILEKKRIGSLITWEPREAFLTSEKLLFAKLESEFVLDEIPLLDVATVSTEVSKDSEQDEDWMELIIETVAGGFNSGRTYIFRAREAECKAWKDAINNQYAREVERRKREIAYARGHLKRVRDKAKEIYDSTMVQSGIAILILISFSMDLAQAQILPEEGSSEAKMFYQIDVAFATIFTVELAVNLFTKSRKMFLDFYSDGWNLIDVVIVALSLLTVLASSIPSFKVLRLVRVFRVARIFRKLKSLNRIITALASAVLPVANSFLILALVTCIWAALGTHFFRFRSDEYFGNFARSLFTVSLLGVRWVRLDTHACRCFRWSPATGETSLTAALASDMLAGPCSWASAIVRSLFDGDKMETKMDYAIALFFVSYVLIAGVFLINVVVAVLLDEFISSIQREKQEIERKERLEQEKHRAVRRANGILDPLTHHLSHFVTEKDLATKISETYERLDFDGSGGLTFEEFQQGLKKLPTAAPIHIQEDDFELLSEGGRLCNSEGEFSAEQFQDMMREEIRRYAQRQVANAMQESGSKELRAILLMIKLLDQRIEAVFKLVDSWGYSNKGKGRILEVFFLCDKEEKGFLNHKEAKEALQELSFPSSRLDEVVALLDKDKDGFISKEEFLYAQEIIENDAEERRRKMETAISELHCKLVADPNNVLPAKDDNLRSIPRSRRAEDQLGKVNGHENFASLFSAFATVPVKPTSRRPQASRAGRGGGEGSSLEVYSLMEAGGSRLAQREQRRETRTSTRKQDTSRSPLIKAERDTGAVRRRSISPLRRAEQDGNSTNKRPASPVKKSDRDQASLSFSKVSERRFSSLSSDTAARKASIHKRVSLPLLQADLVLEHASRDSDKTDRTSMTNGPSP
eukprot:16901-Hanusia_phi.AAC.3